MMSGQPSRMNSDASLFPRRVQKQHMREIWLEGQEITSCPQGFETLYRQAVEFLNDYDWHSGVWQSFLGGGTADQFGVFLLRIRSEFDDVEPFQWVIVGRSLPPVAFGSPEAENWVRASDRYLRILTAWSDAVLDGRSDPNRIYPLASIDPAAASNPKEYALELRSQLVWIKEEVLIPNHALLEELR